MSCTIVRCRLYSEFGADYKCPELNCNCKVRLRSQFACISSVVIVDVVVLHYFVGNSCIMCRRDEDFEHVTLADSETELDSGQLAEFEKVMHVFRLHSTDNL